MSGRMIEPIKVRKGMTVEELVEVYDGMGYNAKRLAEACQLYENMIKEDVTICLTLSGAMTPVGMSGLIINLIENGFVDWMVSTGANCYHDLHRPYGYPMVQGHFNVDDDILGEEGVARIYDVFIADDETLTETDKCLVNAFKKKDPRRGFKYKGKYYDMYSSAYVYHEIGKYVMETAENPEKSFLVSAAKNNVPVYVPAQADSSVGMNIAGGNFLFYLEGVRDFVVEPSPSLDILESAAIVRYAEKNGAIEIGGGVPKNFFMQTQPTLWEILYDSRGGHDYFIQLTDARPDTGGLSGATPSEARSWRKVKKANEGNVVVYGDATVYFPIMAAWVLGKCKPRKKKELYKKRKKKMINLLKRYYNRGFLEKDLKDFGWKSEALRKERMKGNV